MTEIIFLLHYQVRINFPQDNVQGWCVYNPSSPNFLLITSIFINKTTSTHPWSFERDWRTSLTETEAGTLCPENTVERCKFVWGCRHLPKVHHGRLADSEAELRLSLQRAKLIPRVLIPTADFYRHDWHSNRLKKLMMCFKILSITDDLLFLSTIGKKHTVYDCSNLLSLFPLLNQMEFLSE